MDFYYKFVTEAYDLINAIPYAVSYAMFQLIGLWGFVFKSAYSIANIFKFSYLGF